MHLAGKPGDGEGGHPLAPDLQMTGADGQGVGGERTGPPGQARRPGGVLTPGGSPRLPRHRSSRHPVYLPSKSAPSTPSSVPPVSPSSSSQLVLVGAYRGRTVEWDTDGSPA